jgi:hypothetical protein
VPCLEALIEALPEPARAPVLGDNVRKLYRL